MSKKILSLDLGITSIGYSVLDEHKSDKYTLLDYGLSMFDKPLDKDGNSKKLLHSVSASTAKLYGLRKERKQNLAKLFEQYKLSSYVALLQQEKENSYINKWELRAYKAFHEKLEVGELFTILYLLAKHRGYKSLDSADLLEELCEKLNIEIENSSKKKEDDEKGKIKSALKTIENLRLEHPQKTVAQIIYETEVQKPNPTFRNHDNYNYMIRREYINDEIQKIIKVQDDFGFFGNDFNVKEFTSSVIETIDDQKDATNDLNLFGKCQYYKEEIVAHQYSLLSDIFKMYESVANITFNKEGTKITPSQIKLIADDFFAKIKKSKNIADIKYKDIRKILKLDESVKIFNKEDSWLSKGKKQEHTIIKFHFVNNLSKINNEFIVEALEQENKYEKLKDIFDVLAYEKAPHAIYEKLKEKIKDEKSIVDLIRYKSGNSMSISSYAMVKFMPYFEKGLSTDAIKEKLELNRKEDYSAFKKGIKYLHVNQFEKDDDLKINNHPVKYVVSATLRLIKHLHSVHGAFDEIRVESTRELSQNEQTKKDIEKANRALQKEIDTVVANVEYQTIAQNYGKNLRKYARKILLWEEQERLDIYSGKTISVAHIFTNVVDLDHIVPRSLGGLSVKHNFVLAHRDTNVQKLNQLPLNFVEDKQAFINRVEDLFASHKINWKKRKNLLATNLDEIYKDTFESKMLRATSYIEALTAQLLKRYYPFANEKKQSDGSAVRHIQGRATSNIRKLLGVKTKVRDTNIHHAIDAMLIGFTNQSWLQKLSNTFRENMGVIDDEARANIKKEFPIIELVINNEVKYLEPKELMELVEDNYNEFGEESVFYKDVWGRVKAVNYWVSKKPDSSRLHEAGIYGRDKINGQLSENKKEYSGYTTLRIDIIKRLHDTQKKPTFPKIGDDSKKFYDIYQKEVVERLYLYMYNKNDKIVSIVLKKGSDIRDCLEKYKGVGKKDKENYQKAQDELLNIVNEPLVDYNGNIIRKVKIIYSKKYNEKIIRGGTSISERTTLGINVEKSNKKLSIKRIDFKDKIGETLTKTFMSNSINIYRNNLVLFIFKDQNKNRIGYLESYDETDGRARLYNGKYPKLVASQPVSFKEGSSRKRVSIKSSTGIIKLNLDITGNIKSYQSIGVVESELLQVIKESIDGWKSSTSHKTL